MMISTEEDPDVGGVIIVDSLKGQFSIGSPGVKCSSQLALYKLSAEQFGTPIR